MNKKLGIRTSPQLIICRLLIFLLLNGAVLSFIFAFTDFRTTEDLSEETKEELRENFSFRESVKAVYSIKNEGDVYLKVSDIDAIRFLNTVDGSYIYFEMSGSDNDLLFRIYDTGYMAIPNTDYDKIKLDNHVSSGEIKYVGIELEYIKELASEEEYIREWLFEALASRESIDVVKEILTYLQLHGEVTG